MNSAGPSIERSTWLSAAKCRIARDAQLGVRRRQRRLVVDQQFLKQLFAWPQPRVNDTDVLLGESRQADHLARELGDLHWLAHVEHEDLAAAAELRGLQHQLRRL